MPINYYKTKKARDVAARRMRARGDRITITLKKTKKGWAFRWS